MYGDLFPFQRSGENLPDMEKLLLRFSLSHEFISLIIEPHRQEADENRFFAVGIFQSADDATDNTISKGVCDEPAGND
jgi:hypothetical protein